MDPVYRLTIFAPRSVDPTETTVLTPLAGAPHSDPFQIASIRGLAGWRPYLDTIRGRSGRIDPKTRKTDTGQITVSAMDMRTGTGNLERWIMAFLGDDRGRERLLGCKVFVEESLNLGATWSDFWTGRVQDLQLNGRLRFNIVVRDMAEELKRSVFVGRPHSSVSDYANMAPLVPAGITEAYGPFEPELGILGEIDDEGYAATGDTGRRIEIYLESERLRCGKVSQDLYNLDQSKSPFSATSPAARVKVQRMDTLESGEFRLYPMRGTFRSRRWNWFHFWRSKGKKQWMFAMVAIHALEPGDPAYMAMPPVGTKVRFSVISDQLPTEQTPILIDDVHPVTLWRHLLEGKFSRLDEDGAVTRTFDYDAAAFAALEADESIPVGRFPIQSSAKLNEWVEKHICLPYGLAYRLNASGEVVPIDMRLKSSLVGVSTIGNDDVEAATAPAWRHGRDMAITRVEVTRYVERAIPLEESEEEIEKSTDEFPQVSAALIAEVGSPKLYADFPAETDLGEHTLEIDAIGFRAATDPDDETVGQARLDWVERKIDALVEELRGPFVNGAILPGLTCRRTGSTSNCYPGDLRILDIDELPDPATNTRGGARLARCLERTENGPAIRFSFLDLGPQTVAVSPALGALSLVNSDSRPAIDVPVTLNAADDVVVLEFAVTSNAVAVAPADGSSLWTFGVRVTADSTARIEALPHNARVWVRGRSIVTEDGKPQLPSGWVFPTGPDFVDTPITLQVDQFELTVDPVTRRPTARWKVNPDTLGMRVHFGLHGVRTSPPEPLPSSEDFDATLGTATLDVRLVPGQWITAEGEPWSDFVGGAVAGSSGWAVRDEAQLDPDSLDSTLDVWFTVVAKSSTYIDLRVNGGVGVVDIALFDILYDIDETNREEPSDIGQATKILSPGDIYRATIPGKGTERVVYAFGYNEAGASGEGEDFPIGPVQDTNPQIEYVTPLAGSTPTRRSAEIGISDPQGLGGYLRVSTNPDSFDDPDRASFPGAVHEVDPGSGTRIIGPDDFDEIEDFFTHPSLGKVIYVEFVNSALSSSGVQSRYIPGNGTAVTFDDALRPGIADTLALADEAVSRAKVQLAAIGAPQIEDGAATRLKIGLAAIDAARTDISQLSDVATNLGAMVAGRMDNLPASVVFDLNATGASVVFGAPAFAIYANGDATFAGALVAATGTFAGSLTAATGTFAGSLSAATGTFAGSLSAASGTFTGTLTSVDGTFTGSLTSVNGTFTGQLVAASGTFTGSLTAVDGTFVGTLTGVDGTFTGTLTAGANSANPLSALNANIGTMTAGILRNPGNTVGLAIGDFAQPGWASYISFYDSPGVDYFLYGFSGRFRVGHDGNLYATNAYVQGEIHATSGTFSGALNAATGTFSGTVSSTTFTAATATFSGSVRAGSGNPNSILSNTTLSFADSGGNYLADIGLAEGTPDRLILQASGVNTQLWLTAENAMLLQAGAFTFRDASNIWAQIAIGGAPGADDSNLYLNFNGTMKRVKRDVNGNLYV